MAIPDILSPHEQTRITQGSQVALHFEVTLENGEVIDSTFDRPQPVVLTIGDGSFLEGFEKVLMNLTTGDTRTAYLSPDEAFGQWQADNVQTFPKAQFALMGDTPQVGMLVEFEDKAKQTLAGVVKQIEGDIVRVDFNHPLAGQNIVFKVQIAKVIPKGNQAIKFG